MTDKEPPTKRELLRNAFEGVVGANSFNRSTASTPSIGKAETPVDAYLDPDALDWLHAQLHPDGVAYLETVELETNDGTVVFEAENGTITLRYKEEDNE